MKIQTTVYIYIYIYVHDIVFIFIRTYIHTCLIWSMHVQRTRLVNRMYHGYAYAKITT